MLLGAAFFLLSRLNKAKIKPEYNFWVFLDKNWIPTVLNLIGGSILIFGLSIEQGAFVYAGFDFTFVFAGVLGVAGQVIFRGVMDLLNQNIKTRFGFNK